MFFHRATAEAKNNMIITSNQRSQVYFAVFILITYHILQAVDARRFREDSILYQKWLQSNNYTVTNDTVTTDSTEEFRSATVPSLQATAATSNVSYTSYAQKTWTQIETEIAQLAKAFPAFVTVFTSQNKYGLPSPCSTSEKTGCYHTVIILEDKKVYSRAAAARALAEKPDVFFSGALHGDERVGPVAVLETAKLLALAASCEAGLGSTTDCNTFKMKFGAEKRQWLARLVATRRIILTPTTNAKGYSQNTRYETYTNPRNNLVTYIDCNRDFAFDQNPSSCMNSITARTVNEIFWDHLIQMSVTYHGGTELIGYEWGMIDVPLNTLSPDDNAQLELTRSMSQYAGVPQASASEYLYGDMNSIIYGVYGGMEDWAYAGSWLSSLAVQCRPVTYNGYPTNKTTYDGATLRSFNVLIETSNNKNPLSSALGTESGLFTAPYVGGYIPRIIRTTLLAIDIVQPYVQITGFKLSNLSSDLKPNVPLAYRSTSWNVTAGKNQANIQWKVGGAYTVDSTWIVYGKWSNFPTTFNGIQQLKEVEMAAVFNDTTSGKFYQTVKMSGKTQWSNGNARSGAIPYYSATLDLTKFQTGDSIAVYAVAKVDQNWKNQANPQSVWPSTTAPQSHMVHARTDPNWRMEKTKINKVVQGRLNWLSIPLTILIV